MKRRSIAIELDAHCDKLPMLFAVSQNEKYDLNYNPRN